MYINRIQSIFYFCFQLGKVECWRTNIYGDPQKYVSHFTEEELFFICPPKKSLALLLSDVEKPGALSDQDTLEIFWSNARNVYLHGCLLLLLVQFVGWFSANAHLVSQEVVEELLTYSSLLRQVGNVLRI